MPITPNRQTAEQGKKQAKPKSKLAPTSQSVSPTTMGALPLSAAIENPDVATGSIVRLQRAAGNRVVNRLLENRSSKGSRSFGQVQFKLTVGPAGDKYEQEADQVAERVLRMPAPKPTALADPLQREIGFEEEEPAVQREFELHNQAARADDEGGGESGGSSSAGSNPSPPNIRRRSSTAQRQTESQTPTDPRAGFETDSSVEHEITSRAGGGRPLPESTRNFMEPRFGADLSGVRVHTGQSANQLNRKLSAQAFTHGSDIYFGSGKYNPGTTSGNRLLAHELTHVVQQGAAAPVRAKFKPIQRKLIQRLLTTESARAFDSAASANPKYEHGRKLVDKFAKPVKEPGSGAPPPWQTQVDTPLPEDNVTTDEQDIINNTGRTHGLMFWKKSDEQEKKLKDFARAYMLWDFASRTNQLRPDDTAKYGKLSAIDKIKKRKAYMKHASPFQEKFKGLVSKGPSAPETQAFLQQEGFLAAMAITDKQQEKAKAKGPRIDVRSTFIGGPILGINLRAHLFIVYTGRDGKQFYFRGGPGENLDPNDPTTDGYTTADYGEYTASTIDYDPSAPSVTVLQGDAAEAKLDAMIEAAKAVNSMKVPYQAQIETKAEKKFKESKFAKKYKTVGGFIGSALGIFGTKGENCNRAAWTILNRAGVPTNKPVGKHPGWGSVLGADTPGKDKAMPAAEKDDPSAAKKIKLDERRDVAKGGEVQVYLDRMLFQKSDTLPVDTEVEELADEVGYRKIKYGEGKIGYIAKRTSDNRRTLRFKLKAALIARNWYTPQEFNKFNDEVNDGNLGRVLQLLQDVNMDRDYGSMEDLLDVFGDLVDDFGKPGAKLFKKWLDAMSETQIKDLKHDYHEMRGLIEETGVEIEEAIRQVEARIGVYDRQAKIMRAIGEHLTDNLQIDLWVNHYPDYSDVKEIAKVAGEDEDVIFEALNLMRPKAVQGHYIDAVLKVFTSFESLEDVATDTGAYGDWFQQNATWLGVPTEFLIRRITDYYKEVKSARELEAEKKRLKKEQKKQKELELAGKGYDPKDYPGGKHKWPITEPIEVTVSATLEGEANIQYLVDPKKAGPRVAVTDEWTRDYGRGRLEHNGKSYYIDLAVVFGAPKSAKKEEAPKGTSPYEGVLTPPKDKPIVFFEYGGSNEIDAPTRIKIVDEDYLTRDEWAHTFIMLATGGRAGNVYAGDLRKYFKSDAEASGGAKEDVSQEKEEGAKSKPSPTELYPQGSYDWPWTEAVTFKISRVKGGPMDEEKTFDPAGKWKKITVMDAMTLEHGCAILWHNGGQFYVALSDIFGGPEDSEEVLDEGVLEEENVSEDIDDEPDDNNEPEEDVVDEHSDELPFSEMILSILESGADLQDLVYGSHAEPEVMKKFNELQIAKLAKVMGKSVEDVKDQIAELA
jgi:hypothetical protein